MPEMIQELIARLNADFYSRHNGNEIIKSLNEKLLEGDAKYDDAYIFAEQTGTDRAGSFKKILNSSVLPEGRFDYDTAKNLIMDTLGEDHKIISEYATGVQKGYNKNKRIGLKAQTADPDEDRLEGFVKRLASEDNFDNVSWILQEPVITYSRSIVDSTIKKNAEFQHKSGMRAIVIRRAAPKCCDWCSNLEGEYTYPDVPGEVFQRHNNCRCTVDYNGQRLAAYNNGGASYSFRKQEKLQRIKIADGIMRDREQKGLYRIGTAYRR